MGENNIQKMVFLDEQTRQRVQRMPHTGDIEYDLDISAGSAIAMETVPVIGPWEDNTGSDPNVQTKQLMFFAGAENELWGQDSHISDNADLDQLNVVGERARTTRRRLIKRNKDF